MATVKSEKSSSFFVLAGWLTGVANALIKIATAAMEQ